MQVEAAQFTSSSFIITRPQIYQQPLPVLSSIQVVDMR